MLPYWVLFILWAAAALQHERTTKTMGSPAAFRLAAFATAFVVGLRWKVGGDWGGYQNIFNQISLLTWEQAFAYTDPAYGFLNWAVSQVGLSVVTVNLVCAAIFMLGLTAFAERQPNPWLVMAVAVPYFVIVVGMGYTRQGTAIGLVLIGFSVAERRGLLLASLFIVAGALFHKSAALTLPLIFTGTLRRNALYLITGVIASVLLYIFVLRGAADNMIAQYANSQYESSGARIRVGMNVAASIVFFLYRRRFKFSDFQESFWSISSILSFSSVFGLATLSSSVGVDRLALFLIPLQLAVYSRLPYALSNGIKANPRVMLGVLIYSAAVLFIYLNFGTEVKYWLPYRMVPFVSDGS